MYYILCMYSRCIRCNVSDLIYNYSFMKKLRRKGRWECYCGMMRALRHRLQSPKKKKELPGKGALEETRNHLALNSSQD